MPTNQNRKMIQVEIPETFLWAWEYYRRWWENKVTGQFIWDFQDGGIKNVRENIYHKPKKHLTN